MIEYIEEIERIKKMQIGKNCSICKIGKYIKFCLILCDNCGKEPFKNY